MSDLTLQTVLLRLVALVIIAPVVGLAGAAAARLLGDAGPAQDGRLTINPFVHLDVLGAAALTVFGYGWIKPLDLTPSRLRGGVLGVLIVIVAALVALLATAMLARALLPLAATSLSDSAAPLAAAFIRTFVAAATSFVVINLLPVPPLLAGHLLGALWPAAGTALRRAAMVVGIGLIAALATGYLQDWLTPGVGMLRRLLG